MSKKAFQKNRQKVQNNLKAAKSQQQKATRHIVGQGREAGVNPIQVPEPIAGPAGLPVAPETVQPIPNEPGVAVEASPMDGQTDRPQMIQLGNDKERELMRMHAGDIGAIEDNKDYPVYLTDGKGNCWPIRWNRFVFPWNVNRPGLTIKVPDKGVAPIELDARVNAIGDYTLMVSADKTKELEIDGFLVTVAYPYKYQLYHGDTFRILDTEFSVHFNSFQALTEAKYKEYKKKKR